MSSKIADMSNEWTTDIDDISLSETGNDMEKNLHALTPKSTLNYSTGI